MSDQDPQTPETPDTSEQQPVEHNWEKRYQDLQPEYTRAAQEAAEYRRQIEGIKNGDPEVLAALGLEYADQDEPDDEDPEQFGGETDAQYEARIAALEERFEQQSQNQQLEAMEQHVEQVLDALPDLDDTDRDLVVKLAVQMDPTEDGMPDINGAFQILNERDTQKQKRWAGTKRAPAVSPVGQAGTQQPDMSDEKQRIAYMAERLRSSD